MNENELSAQAVERFAQILDSAKPLDLEAQSDIVMQLFMIRLAKTFTEEVITKACVVVIIKENKFFLGSIRIKDQWKSLLLPFSPQ